MPLATPQSVPAHAGKSNAPNKKVPAAMSTVPANAAGLMRDISTRRHASANTKKHPTTATAEANHEESALMDEPARPANNAEVENEQ